MRFYAWLVGWFVVEGLGGGRTRANLATTVYHHTVEVRVETLEAVEAVETEEAMLF